MWDAVDVAAAAEVAIGGDLDAAATGRIHIDGELDHTAALRAGRTLVVEHADTQTGQGKQDEDEGRLDACVDQAAEQMSGSTPPPV